MIQLILKIILESRKSTTYNPDKAVHQSVQPYTALAVNKRHHHHSQMSLYAITTTVKCLSDIACQTRDVKQQRLAHWAHWALTNATQK